MNAKENSGRKEGQKNHKRVSTDDGGLQDFCSEYCVKVRIIAFSGRDKTFSKVMKKIQHHEYENALQNKKGGGVNTHIS